ncbi:MAG: hypothetical protein WCX77_02670 [Candidatus Paceibacterota bacterium]|jgi:adenylate kinase
MNLKKIVKNRVYFVGGINGVGKSTLVNEFLKNEKGFLAIKGSQYFMEWLGLRSGDYESLQNMPHEKKNEELGKMVEYLIYDLPADNKPILMDIHYLRIVNGEISRVLNDWVSLSSGMFFIAGNSKIILERQKKDLLAAGRDRKMFPSNVLEKDKESLIEKYQKETLQEVKRVSDKFGIPYFVINNIQLEKASNELKIILNKLEAGV